MHPEPVPISKMVVFCGGCRSSTASTMYSVPAGDQHVRVYREIASVEFLFPTMY